MSNYRDFREELRALRKESMSLPDSLRRSVEDYLTRSVFLVGRVLLNFPEIFTDISTPMSSGHYQKMVTAKVDSHVVQLGKFEIEASFRPSSPLGVQIELRGSTPLTMDKFSYGFFIKDSQHLGATIRKTNSIIEAQLQQWIKGF